MGQMSDEDEAIHEGFRQAQQPFVQFSIEARNKELREAGHQFHTCTEDQNNDSWSSTPQQERGRKERVKEVVIKWVKQWEHGFDGPHFASCGHPISHVPMHKWKRISE